MKSLFRKILLGDTMVTEYSTVTIEADIKESVFLEIEELAIDISTIHWVLCLEPIVFGVWLKRGGNTIDINGKTKSRMYFCGCSGKEFSVVRKSAMAIVALDYFDKIEEPDGTLYLLQLKESNIYHLNFIKTWVLFNKYYKKPKFSFARYKSLITAYSYPRRVRIISFKRDDYINIFPMDLLGEIPQSNKYVFGLRHTNVTLAKIIESKKIVASEVPFTCKETIYELGKHHGGNPPKADSLPFKLKQMENFGFPIPEWAESYKEIQILKTKNLGSHMLLWGEILNEKKLGPSSGNLYHIHFLLYYHQKLKGREYRLV